MKRLVYVGVIVLCMSARHFVALEKLTRDESQLKVPPFIATEHRVEEPRYINPMANASVDEVKAMMLPLLESESIEKAAELLKDLPEQRARDIVDLVLSDKTFTLDPVNRRLFLAAVAALYEKTPDKQKNFLEVLAKHPDLYQGTPYMYTLIANDYEKAVPWVVQALSAWEKEKKITLPQTLCELVERTYVWTIQNNDVHVLQHLAQQGVPLARELASQLLWQAASLPQSDPLFVSTLVKHGADVGYVKDGYTTLMKAVLANNLPFVQTLVEHGASIDTVINPEIGSALQLAIEKSFVPVELYLRNHGAHL